MVHVPPDVARSNANPLNRLAVKIAVAGLHAASAAAGKVPRQTWAEPICGVAGAIWYLGRPGARAAVFDNLQHVLGRQPTRRQAMRVFQHGALNYWDTFALPHFTLPELLRL